MPWPWSSENDKNKVSSWEYLKGLFASSERPPKPVQWDQTVSEPRISILTDPRQWVTAGGVLLTTLITIRIYSVHLKRIPSVAYILPGFYRKRNLFGRVTSVGDGDNFHVFHTPGGKWTGWGWARRVPTEKKELRGRTIPVRIAGIDAPECAHFGRPAQPFSEEALLWLRGYLLNRSIRAFVYRRDQYDRVVATVEVRKWLFFKKDVGLEMLKRGLATTYEAKTGSEFGGKETEKLYRATEATAKRKGVGMWSLPRASESKGWFGLGKGHQEVLETPREYKTRMAQAEKPVKAD